jgi:hypothetical protein
VAPPFGKCVWCERDDFTVEHIIGQQFTKALGVPFPATLYWGNYALPGNAEIALEDRVCDTCNRNWMRKLDNRVMQFMRPTVHREARVQLNLRKQETLAMWAAKVALLLILRRHDLQLKHPELSAMGSPFAPDDNFAAIERSKRRPPKHTRVWLASLDPRERMPKFIATSGSFSNLEAESYGQTQQLVPHGYFVVFGLGRLIVYINGWETAYTGPRQDDRPELVLGATAVRRIWPSTERTVEWPPPAHVVTNDLERLVQVPADWRGPPQLRRRLVEPPESAKP